MKKTYLSFLFIFILLISSGCEIFISEREPLLEVHFIDVGQGDASLIISPNGKTMLIDAGDNSKGREVVEYIKRQGVRKIDVLIGTHPHADHIGGMDDVINSFEIGEFYMPKKIHTTKTFEDVLLAAKSKGITIKEAYEGREIDFDTNIDTRFLSPIKDKNYSDELNLYSAVVRMVYDKDSFIFMGDAEAPNEEDILKSFDDIQSDVIKLGHHGSSTSTTKEFLDKVSPYAAVVSAGYKNKYSHPHKEVLTLLEENSIPVYRTDEQGTIVFKSKGDEITVNQDPGTYIYRKGN